MSRWDALYLMFVAAVFAPVLLTMLAYALRWWKRPGDPTNG